MHYFRFIVAAAFLSGMTLTALSSCKTQAKTTETPKAEAPKADSTGTAKKPGNTIQTSGKVQSGTFVNGPAQDTSSTGSKPKQ